MSASHILIFSLTLSLLTLAKSEQNYVSVVDDSESIADFLFRYQIFRRSKDYQRIFVDEDNFADNSAKMAWLWGELGGQVLPSPLLATVQYLDPYKTSLRSVTLTADGIEENVILANSINDYLTASIPLIEQRLEEGYTPVSLSFDDVQNTQFLTCTTLANETIRICGLTPEIKEMLAIELMEFFQENNLPPVEAIYFYGSRVMPRSEVIKRNPDFLTSMPINDKGIEKTAVRIKGMTEISDLEIMVLFSSTTDYNSEELRLLAKTFKRRFAQIFRDFPIGPKFIKVDNDEKIDDPFDYIIHRFENTQKPLSHFQFVEAGF